MRLEVVKNGFRRVSAAAVGGGEQHEQYSWLGQAKKTTLILTGWADHVSLARSHERFSIIGVESHK
jgi:hypothetical protein